jgi:glycosyltransferase involved in cell wall biosynthesis
MSGYARASFQALRDQGADIYLVHRGATDTAPYDDEALDLGAEGMRWSEAPDASAVLARVRAFEPDTVFAASWDVGAYRQVCRRMRGEALRLLFMDNAWLGTPKQWAGRFVSPLVIRPTFDAVFLAGEPQARFARRLGFPEDRILWGVDTCDHPAFAAVHRAGATPPKAFLFVGRLAAEKGVDILAQAYERYRRAVRQPWPLLVAGTGPMEHVLSGVPGVTLLGFVQPQDAPDLFAQAGCLLLPSRFEPWGVVIHEATAAGRAVVCTTACGASTRLVLDGYNGLVIGPGDVSALADAMAHMSAADDASRATMGRRSAQLSEQFTPVRWATYLQERTGELRGRLGLDTA